MFQTIAEQINKALDLSFRASQAFQISTKPGGCINEAYVIAGETHQFFVKLNHSEKLSMFDAEAAGLQAIAKSRTIRVPKVIF